MIDLTKTPWQGDSLNCWWVRTETGMTRVTRTVADALTRIAETSLEPHRIVAFRDLTGAEIRVRIDSLLTWIEATPEGRRLDNEHNDAEDEERKAWGEPKREWEI